MQRRAERKRTPRGNRQQNSILLQGRTAPHLDGETILPKKSAVKFEQFSIFRRLRAELATASLVYSGSGQLPGGMVDTCAVCGKHHLSAQIEFYVS
jgi:hypothetical protein